MGARSSFRCHFLLSVKSQACAHAFLYMPSPFYKCTSHPHDCSISQRKLHLYTVAMHSCKVAATIFSGSVFHFFTPYSASEKSLFSYILHFSVLISSEDLYDGKLRLTRTSFIFHPHLNSSPLSCLLTKNFKEAFLVHLVAGYEKIVLILSISHS